MDATTDLTWDVTQDRTIVLRHEEAGLGQSTDGRLRTSGAAKLPRSPVLTALGTTIAPAHLVTEQQCTTKALIDVMAAMPLQKLRPLTLLPG